MNNYHINHKLYKGKTKEQFTEDLKHLADSHSVDLDKEWEHVPKEEKKATKGKGEDKAE